MARQPRKKSILADLNDFTGTLFGKIYLHTLIALLIRLSFPHPTHSTNSTTENLYLYPNAIPHRHPHKHTHLHVHRDPATISCRLGV